MNTKRSSDVLLRRVPRNPATTLDLAQVRGSESRTPCEFPLAQGLRTGGESDLTDAVRVRTGLHDSGF